MAKKTKLSFLHLPDILEEALTDFFLYSLCG